MKTERRHDLETNELARKTTEAIETLKPHASQLLGALAAVLAVIVAISLWTSHKASQEDAAWDAYAVAITTSSESGYSNLQRIASDPKYDGTTMQEWSYISWADQQFFLATMSYLMDRTITQDTLRKIEEVYRELSTGASDTQVRNRARFGLARVYELQDKVDEAIAAYRVVEGDFALVAEERAKQLEEPEVQEDLQWLATAELPKRATPGGPGNPGEMPNFDIELPSANDGLGGQTLESILGAAAADSKDEEARYEEDAEPKESYDGLFEDETVTDVESDAGDATPPAADEQPAESTSSDEQ